MTRKKGRGADTGVKRSFDARPAGKGRRNPDEREARREGGAKPPRRDFSGKAAPVTAKPRDVNPWGDSPGDASEAGRTRLRRDGKAVFAGRGRGAKAPAMRRTPADIALLYGFHSVSEALKSQRRTLLRLYATQAAAARLEGEIAARKLPVEIVSADEIDARLPADAVHQGLLLEARHHEPIALADLPANALVLVLDQISDPHNVGAIVRTAAAFGVDAIVTTERHSPEFTGVLAKAASGGLEHVAIASIVNLARGLEELGDMGFLRVGLDSEGPVSLAATELRRPLALVLGAEGKGLRRLSRENCDVLARLDMPGRIKSLNVSNACAVALTLALMKV